MLCQEIDEYDRDSTTYLTDFCQCIVEECVAEKVLNGIGCGEKQCSPRFTKHKGGRDDINCCLTIVIIKLI